MNGTMTATAALAAVLLLPLAANAQVAAPQGCFATRYDSAELASHPDQVASEIWLEIVGDPGDLYGHLSIVSPNSGRAKATGLGGRHLEQYLYCYDDAAPVVCEMDCDGSALSITRNMGDTIEITTSHMMVTDSDECGSGLDLATRMGQAVTYRLHRIDDDANCGGR